ncbi:MAG: 16S rRNA (guanine(966)-N(2))-methyltransferase RsmD [Arachnia sp.]
MSRIIAGHAKGRPLATPKGSSTRPTTDRVKEALFSALSAWFGSAAEAPEHQLAGVAVLDLFAGSGSLGLEAASRGAASVTCVDSHTASVIRDNVAKMALRTVTVTSRRVENVVAEAGPAFDLVLMDPPYEMSKPVVDELLSALVEGERLTLEALVVVERSSRTGAPDWPAEFTTTWDRRYGETTLHFGATDPPQSESDQR